MTAKNFGDVLSADGTYVFPAPSMSRCGVIEVVGTVFGGGTVTLGFDDGSGNFVVLNDGNREAVTTTAAAGWEITMPTSGRLAVNITGSTSPAIKVNFKPLPK